ncbi:hydantoinase B/oxoprolinase family protein [Ketogulonicigenium vulgare]|uniref:N-methylhydantoinase (ATP-hydrolyzing) B 2 n=1 Tax=Ketogulonicigenium vulgare (strain WSH-001) TaxID=759362 RepID=F9YBS5_KETVW|nr:hydantoinase B/oxoprolinase family protein [Ketogulonicigenium vulgare]AEM42827.1 N-methylhydantoinase (ATP-hydrolyzing) B 2 [Ketogulonicigenium vulgare WSH-001]ALJ82744.1 methylhydantoinase [Ketogulonicigenium vulgare]
MTDQHTLIDIDVPAGTCDPITLEIVRGAIVATQKEMEALIERTAISAFIREKKDFYTALFDDKGKMAVGSMVPIFGDLTTPVIEKFPRASMRPGDLYWYNDCYGSKGAVTHSNDQVLLAPVFHDNRLCAFVMCWAHFADIGGIYPGSISPDATSIYQEGIIVPPTKLVDAGVVNEMALAIFHRNSRFPAQSEGDLSALMAAVALGSVRVAEIVALRGADVVQDALAQLLERNRLMVRGKLAETFDYGTYKFTDSIDTDGHGNGPFRITFSLTRERDADGADIFTFDASESDDQAPGPVNLLMNKGVPGMALGLYYLGGDPSQVCNAGGPLSLDNVIYREGSIVQPRFPAPLGMRGLTMMRTLAVINGLVNVAGGGAPASHSAYVINIMRGTYTNPAGESEPFLLADGIGVGYGARPNADGIDAVYFVAQENYPVEFLEMGYPVRLLRYGVLPDSGGPGKFRGGVGIVREYEILADEAQIAIRIDGVQNPPWGIGGGMSGGVGAATVNPGQANERKLPPLSEGTKLHYGDILRIETGGGGGYGHPHDRAPADVLEDVLGGFVTAEAAEKYYGVKITDDAVDDAATAALRAMRPATRAFHRKEYLDELV